MRISSKVAYPYAKIGKLTILILLRIIDPKSDAWVAMLSSASPFFPIL